MNVKLFENLPVDVGLNKAIGSGGGLGSCFNAMCAEKSVKPSPSSWFDKLPKSHEPDKLIAADMGKLSMQEREQVYEDIHGVRDVVDEMSRDIPRDLNDLEIELSKIPQKAEYDLAQHMSNAFVQDRKLRMMFLRASWFDVSMAAKMIVKFFAYKLKYFGPDKLTTHITMADLDEDCLNCLKEGRWQVLPSRDRSGRAVLFIYGKKGYQYESMESMFKSAWFLVMCMMEDEETQRKGIVVVNYRVGCDDFSEHQMGFHFGKLSQSLPIRREGVHFCFNNSTILPIASAIVKGIDTKSRIRVRFHEGSHIECSFSLMTYGIPIHAIPISSNGELKTDNHMKWFKRRKIKEAAIKAGQNFDATDLPTPNDVLLGKGKPIQEHPGNVRLRDIVEENKEHYDNTFRGEKAAIANKIVQIIKESSGRFLKVERNGWWSEVSDDMARAKVSHALRLKRS